MIDAVCRLWIFFDKNYTTDHLKIYYNAWGFQNAEISGNYKQFLELAGLYERMVPVSHVIRAKEIWIPSYTMSFSKTYSEKYNRTMISSTKAVVFSGFDRFSLRSHFLKVLSSCQPDS